MPYEYNATVIDIVDGDTITVDIDLGFNVKLANQKVRLLGVDTPESRTSDKIEKIFGMASKEYCKKFIDECKDKTVVIRTYLSDNEEKFGRLLGEIINPTTKKILNEELIKNNYAVKYLGENKDNIKSQHLANRKKLIDAKIVNLSYKEVGL